jgi:GGDEF domain-containing protein
VATSRSTRARRFALPDHGDDDRTVESIEAFLDGPEVRRHRPPIRRPRKGYPNTGSANGATAPGAGTDAKPAAKGQPGTNGRNGTAGTNGTAGPNDKSNETPKSSEAATNGANGTADETPKSSEAPTNGTNGEAGTNGTAGPNDKSDETPKSSEAATNGASASASTAVVPAPDSAATTYAVRPVTDIRTIPGRLEFNTALERESMRAARYGRPAAVAIVELVPVRVNQAIDIWLRSLAGPVSRTLRQSTRATDLVARVANARFQVLLPETPQTGAGRFAERVTSACQTSIDETGAPVSVRVTIAAATPEHSLHEALTSALQSIEAA